MKAAREQGPTRVTAAPFALPPDFLARYWRRQPLHLPGAGGAFLPDPPSRDEINALISDGAPHQTDGATVWFLEGRTSGLTGIEALVAEARDWLEWRDVWCDVFLTRGRSSIGSHYDGSDNFTLQLTGNKTWFLSGPDAVHPDDRRRRVLGEPGLGAAAMPDAPVVFDVRAGDALYIPSNWIHWGFSDGDSTSVSLVVNVATPVHALQEQVLRGLRQDPQWAGPLPVGPGSAAVRAKLLRELVARDVPGRLREDAYRRVADREGGPVSLKGQIDVSMSPPSADVSWAGDHPAGPALTPRGIDAGVLHELVRLRAHRNLGRLLSLCAERYGRTDSDDARRVYAAVATGVRGMPSGALQSLLGDPELSSWLTLAERDSATAAQRSRVEDPLAHALGLIALPDLAAHLPAGQPVTFDAATDEDGCLTLRRAGLRLLFPDRPRRVAMRAADHAFDGLGPHESVPLAATSTGITVTTQWSDWLARVAPGPGPGGPVRRAADWAERLQEAAAVASLVDEATLGLVPWVILRAQVPGRRSGEHSVPGMPGLLVLDVDDAARWPLDLASACVRAEFDLIAGACPLFEDEPASAHGKTASLALRRRYLRGRLREAGILPASPGAGAHDASPDWEPARLTAWGRAVLARATGC